MRGVLGVLVALSLASSTMLSGCASPPTLVSGDVEDQISEGLGEQVGGEFTVVCPSGMPAEAGTTFTCTVTDASDGSTVSVIVTESDDAGGFDWRVQEPSATPSPASSPSTG